MKDERYKAYQARQEMNRRADARKESTMIDRNEIAPELMPILDTLQDEGIEVYTYRSSSRRSPRNPDGIARNSLYWYDEKTRRVLNIQPDHFYHPDFNHAYHLSVSYKPNRTTGSGCGLSPEGTGTAPAKLLNYRREPTWVKSWYPRAPTIDYKSMEHFLNRETTLDFQPISRKEKQP